MAFEGAFFVAQSLMLKLTPSSPQIYSLGRRHLPMLDP
jgi:hypothetical protein